MHATYTYCTPEKTFEVERIQFYVSTKQMDSIRGIRFQFCRLPYYPLLLLLFPLNVDAFRSIFLVVSVPDR